LLNRQSRLTHIIVTSLVLASLYLFSLPQHTSAALGDETVVGTISLVPTIECIGVVSNFTSDNNQNNNAILEYRQAGTSTWKTAPQMYADRSSRQYRGSIFWLTADTTYEVRVTYTDSDGVTGSSITGTTTTVDDNPTIGADYRYVSPSGSDSNSGSLASPWLTIQHAFNSATPGMTILLRGGTYNQTAVISTSGTASQYITLMPYTGESATIDGSGRGSSLLGIEASYIRIKGLTLRNASESAIYVGDHYGYNIIEDCVIENPTPDYGAIVLWQETHHVIIQDNTFIMNGGGYSSGVYYWRSAGTHVIRGNLISSTTGAMMDGFGGGPEDETGYMSNCDFYNNTVIGADDDGISIEGGDINVRIWGNRIEGSFMGIALCPVLTGPAYVFRNTIINSTGGEFKLGDNSYGRIYIYHNTYYSTGSNGNGFTQTNSGLGNIVSRNNITYAGRYVYEMGGVNDFDYDNMYTTDTDSAGRFVKWNNIQYGSLSSFQNATAQEPHGLSEDTNFVNAANGNLNLQQTSACIDAGEILPGFNDANSPWPYSGSAPDIGAYEYGSGGPTNSPPVLGVIGNKSVNAGQTLQFTVSATDPDGNTLTYSASNLPIGATFNPSTRTFSWTPTSSQAGTYHNVRFTVSDGSLTDYEDITITVLSDDNNAPVLSTIGNKSVNVGQTLLFTISATDADGDTLTYSASNLPSGATFNPSTRTFSWTPTSSQAGTYPNVRFTVSDGSLTDYENITITVLIDDNNAPVLSTIGNKSVNVGQTLQFTISATDADGDTLTYSASNLPSGATFNPSTRTFSWTPTSSQAGSYPNVRFTVSDGSLTDYEYITITVSASSTPQSLPLRVNAAGNEYIDSQSNVWVADQAYTSGSWGFYGPDNTVNRGTAHSISGTVDDRIYQTERWGLSGYRFDLANGTYDVVLHFAETYSGITGPGQRVFDVFIEGQLVLNDLDIYSEVGYSTALEKVFNNVVVQDGQLNIEFVSSIEEPEINGIEILSAGSNSAPVLGIIGNKSVNVGQTLQFTVSATDADGDTLTYSASNLPSGATFTPSTRTFSWTPTSSQAGSYPNVRFTVSDGSLTDYEYITITVVEFYEDWDVNSDGATNILDVILVGQHWGETGLTGWIRADVNKDGIINVLDMIIIGQNWTG
jgi:hypothetical protein